MLYKFGKVLQLHRFLTQFKDGRGEIISSVYCTNTSAHILFQLNLKKLDDIYLCSWIFLAKFIHFGHRNRIQFIDINWLIAVFNPPYYLPIL
jgi:hypothetical protein